MNLGENLNKHIELLLREILEAAENVSAIAKAMLEDINITSEQLEQIGKYASIIGMNKSYINGSYENIESIIEVVMKGRK